MPDSGEDSGEAVVVALGIDRTYGRAVGAVDRQAKKGRAGGGDHIVEVVGALLPGSLDGLIADRIMNARDQETRGDLDVGISLAHDVARQLLVINWG